jgi:hypothetical protein
MVLLMYKENYFNINDLDHVVPSVAISLLWEFEDVFSKNILNGLPPLRGIEHKIVLLPKNVIPN